MSTENHSFCRIFLKVVMTDVRTRVKQETIKKHAWGYKYSEETNVEFHINPCDEVPDGFDWFGSGCCVWEAKAHGWQKYMESIDEKENQKKK